MCLSDCMPTVPNTHSATAGSATWYVSTESHLLIAVTVCQLRLLTHADANVLSVLSLTGGFAAVLLATCMLCCSNSLHQPLLCVRIEESCCC